MTIIAKNKLLVLCLLLPMCLMGIVSSAQVKTQSYYNTHESEILPDAKTAFRNGDYERTIELCSWHYVIVGDSMANSLKEKASQCAVLSREIGELSTAGNINAALEKARALLEINPNDKVALELTSSGSISISSSPSGATIYLDGRSLDRTTPAIVEGIPLGEHKIKLVMDGYDACMGTITIDAGKKADISLVFVSGSHRGHGWVDLGLPSGTKWATCNVGATKPDGFGDYYAWGEIKTKYKYDWTTLRYCTDTKNDDYGHHHFTKYVQSNRRSLWRGDGRPDNKMLLEPGDDAACQNWGGKWRMPTNTQWQELKDLCSWSWTGSGYKVTGPNGQSITIPAAGERFFSYATFNQSYLRDNLEGHYWSSCLAADYPFNAWHLNFDRSGNIRLSDGGNRCWGYSVRPVLE